MNRRSEQWLDTVNIILSIWLRGCSVTRVLKSKLGPRGLLQLLCSCFQWLCLRSSCVPHILRWDNRAIVESGMLYSLAIAAED